MGADHEHAAEDVELREGITDGRGSNEERFAGRSVEHIGCPHARELKQTRRSNEQETKDFGTQFAHGTHGSMLHGTERRLFIVPGGTRRWNWKWLKRTAAVTPEPPVFIPPRIGVALGGGFAR